MIKRETVLADIMDEIKERWFEETTSDYVATITSSKYIQMVCQVLLENKDKFISTAIKSEEWEYYDFWEFTASYPIEWSKSDGCMDKDVKFHWEVVVWFLKAQALSIYHEDLEEFYIQLFC